MFLLAGAMKIITFRDLKVMILGTFFDFVCYTLSVILFWDFYRFRTSFSELFGYLGDQITGFRGSWKQVGILMCFRTSAGWARNPRNPEQWGSKAVAGL